VVEFVEVTQGLNGQLGIEFVEVTADRGVVRMLIDERHHQPYGVVHGGVYASLVEVAASLPAAVWAAENGIAGSVGINNNTDFIRATRQGVLRAEASPVHRGPTQQIWMVEIHDEELGKLRARGQLRLQNINNLDTVGS
jgi:1,4-dihydroxy-2-naphthoyl-CoA hydrolase